MPLIYRRDLNRPLTFEEMDGNLEYLDRYAEDVEIVVEHIDEISEVAASINGVNAVAGSLPSVITTSLHVNSIETVAGDVENIDAVAGLSAEVTTVAGIADDITAVAGDIANIDAVAGDLTNIDVLAAVSTDISTVASIEADVTTVAGVSSDVSTLSAISDDILTVSSINGNITTVANNSANITTVATNIAEILAAQGYADDAATSAGEAAASALAALGYLNSTEVIYNHFDERYLGAKSTPPTTDNQGQPLTEGALYFNTTMGLMYVYHSSAWQSIAATGGVDSVNGRIGDVVLTASDVGLGNVTNESKATMFTSPTFTGNAVLGTPASGNFSTGTFTWPTFNQNTTGTANNITAYTINQDVGTSNSPSFSGLTLSGGTANGVLYLNSSKQVTSGSGLVFDASGNLGLGVTPSAWGAAYRAFDLYGAGIASSTTGGQTWFTQNAYNNGTNFIYKYTAPATGYHQLSGEHRWFTAPSGTAGNAITFTEQMRLTSSGNLGIGTTSPTNTLSVAGNANITGNTTLGDASTDTVQVNGYMGIGGAPNASVGIYLRSTAHPATGATSGYGIFSDAPFASDVTSSASALAGRVRTEAAAYTTNNAYALFAQDAIKGSGSTITNQHGVYIADQTQGTNNYGITSIVSSGTNKWNIYASGTAANYFAGNVGIGTSLPDAKLDVNGGNIKITNTIPKIQAYDSDTANNYCEIDMGNGDFKVNIDPENVFGGSLVRFSIDGSERLRIDSSGNLGIGVTPSAWTSYKAIQVGPIGSLSSVTGATLLGNNVYYNGSLRYIATEAATMYGQEGRVHKWYTAPSGTAGTAISFTQAMTLDASGNLLVGGTSVYAATMTAYGSASRSGGLGIRNSAGTAVGGIYTYAAGSGGGSTDIIVEGVNSLQFYTNSAERARIDSSGNLLVGKTSATANGGDVQVSKGITFPATQVACSDANTLDDYEEGTFTPTIIFSTVGDLSVAYSTNSGTYTKVGNRVTIDFIIVTSTFTWTTASSYFYIKDLPFASGSRGIGSVYFGGITTSSYTQAVPGSIGAGYAYADISLCKPGGSTATATAASFTSGTNITLYGTITYKV